MLKQALIVSTLAASIAACSTLSLTERNTKLSDPFAEALRMGYIDLADFEREQGDLGDGRWYEKKIDMLFAGQMPAPATLDNRDIPTEHLNELASARNALITAIGQGATRSEPTLLANAQTSYDCWVEQQEENFQPDHIAACRDRFMAALAKLNGAMTEVATPDPVKEMDAYIVFFGFDSSSLTPAAQKVLDEIVSAADDIKPDTISVHGHADRRGDITYNQTLSEKRAQAVQKYLAHRGVTAKRIAARGHGETMPRVPTADGIAEPGNRYVKIQFSK